MKNAIPIHLTTVTLSECGIWDQKGKSYFKRQTAPKLTDRNPPDPNHLFVCPVDFPRNRTKYHQPEYILSVVFLHNILIFSMFTTQDLDVFSTSGYSI
ncbi:uncharacterized protein METZ01_LOCUS147116, partial [marine metagenome]